jgi:hypothetical protein
MKKITMLAAISLVALCGWQSNAQNGGDDCASAVVVVPGTFTETTITDTTPGLDNGDAAWFSYTPSDNGTVTIDSGIDLDLPDTRISIYDNCTDLNLLIQDDDDGPGLTSLITDFPVIGGTEYILAWDDRWSVEPFDWELSFTPDPLTCGDKFYDTGGPMGVYQNNEDYSLLISPDDPGSFVTLDFLFVEIEANFDELRIFDGDDATAPELSDPALGVQAPGEFTSSVAGGNLFITFTSDSSVALNGWDADVLCSIPPPVCGGKLYDTGGPDSDYQNNEDYSLLISPDDAASVVTLDFLFVEIEDGFDNLRIYDGDDATAPELSDPALGVQAPGQFSGTVAGGNLFITFTSDSSVTQGGWDADVLCSIPPPVCGGKFYDTGGPGAAYQNGEDYSLLISPDDAANVVTLDFLFVEIEANFDELRIFDGDDATAPELSDPALGVQAPGQFSGTVAGGNLFITFTSDSSVTQGGWDADVLCAEPVIPCEAPTNIVVDNETGTGADVSWDAAPSAVDGYIVEVYPAGATTGQVDSQLLPPGTLSTTIDSANLMDDTAYDVYVSSLCDSSSDPQDIAISDAVPFNTILGLENSSIVSYVIFPNPANNEINLKAAFVIENISIISVLGQEVLNTKGGNSELTLDISNLQSGTYFIKATVNNTDVVERFIKK